MCKYYVIGRQVELSENIVTNSCTCHGKSINLSGL